MATWDDAPHLSDDEKKELWNSIPPYQRDARSKGIPQLGSGAIYPVPEEDIAVSDFPIPAWWKRSYGLDVGWNMTAAIWSAWDQDADIVYLYSEYYTGQAEPAVHAQGIKSRGEWIRGVIDPASSGRSQKDGEQLVHQYRVLGLNLTFAINAVEAGLFEVYNRMVSGRIKIFRSLRHWFEEYRMYRRDENGKIVKQADHLMDATRYDIMSGLQVASFMPLELTGKQVRKNDDYDPLHDYR